MSVESCLDHVKTTEPSRLSQSMKRKAFLETKEKGSHENYVLWNSVVSHFKDRNESRSVEDLIGSVKKLNEGERKIVLEIETEFQGYVRNLNTGSSRQARFRSQKCN